MQKLETVCDIQDEMKKTPQMFSSTDHQSWDLLWQRIDNEGEEESEDDKND